jgi:hypothetical protein
MAILASIPKRKAESHLGLQDFVLGRPVSNGPQEGYLRGRRSDRSR